MVDPSEAGIIGNFKSYPFQVVSIQPGDVLLIHISDNLDFNSCSNLMKELKEEFPNNTVLLSNEHVLQGLTVLRHNNIFEEYQNDFLY